jgi:aminoglycoside phosphotransferase (APT) family kinase protein
VSASGESDLAGLLTGLRSVPAREAAALGLPLTPPRSLDTLRAAARGAARRLGDDGEFDPAPLERLTARGVTQLAPRARGVLVHGALTGDHLRVTREGRVSGVLHWADAIIGDPAEDIAGLAVSVGAPAAVRAATLAGYGPRECLRGLWLARCDAVLRLADRLHTDDGRRAHGADSRLRDTQRGPLPRLRAQLRRAWEPILLERLSEGEAHGG